MKNNSILFNVTALVIASTILNFALIRTLIFVTQLCFYNVDMNNIILKDTIIGQIISLIIISLIMKVEQD